MDKNYHTPNLGQDSAKIEHHNYSHNRTKLKHVLKSVLKAAKQAPMNQEHEKAFSTAESILLRPGTTSTEFTPSKRQTRQWCSGNTIWRKEEAGASNKAFCGFTEDSHNAEFNRWNRLKVDVLAQDVFRPLRWYLNSCNYKNITVPQTLQKQRLFIQTE